MNKDLLFQPLTIKSLVIPNRIVMSPMTRSSAASGVPTGDMADYYRRRAEGGVGLILSEGTGIDRPASAYSDKIPRFHGEEALNGWKHVIDEVHRAGGLMGPQLWHVGGLDSAGEFPEPGRLESPSGLCAPDTPAGVAMTERDVADTIDAFARAARSARDLGFDCVEIHGAHGYLVDQFFWDGTNRREDQYGGKTLKERARFAAEVIRAVRRAVGGDFVISLRLSQWKLQDFDVKMAATPEEMEAWLTPLAEAGVDIFHCSQRRFWEPEFEGSDLNFAGWTKKLTGKHTITVGSVGLEDDFLSSFSGNVGGPAVLDRLLERLDRGEFDLVAVGRAILSDPEWARKIRENRQDELKGFVPEALENLY